MSIKTAEWLTLFLFIVFVALFGLFGCASSVRDLAVELPNGLKATAHARDLFSEAKVRLKITKKGEDWSIVYGRETDPDEDAIKAAGGVAADVAGAVVREAMKTAIKAAPVPGL